MAQKNSAMLQALKDIREDLRKEGKSFLAVSLKDLREFQYWSSL